MGRPTVILAATPFALDKNYGRAVNEFFQLLPEDGWGIVCDHDAMWTTPHWYAQIAEAVAFQPRAMFTGLTNRIASAWQRAPGVDPTNHDILYHRTVGSQQLQKRTLLDVTHTKGIGGVCMVVSKAAWREVGGFVEYLYCTDHRMHFAHADVGRPVYVIESLYVYHFRRGDGATVIEEPKAPCRCRGAETWPTERLALP